MWHSYKMLIAKIYVYTNLSILLFMILTTDLHKHVEQYLVFWSVQLPVIITFTKLVKWYNIKTLTIDFIYASLCIWGVEESFGTAFISTGWM